jgi:hypothetical protein
MYSQYSVAKSPVAKPLDDKEIRTKLLKEKHYKNKTRRMANMSYMRREDWLLDTTNGKDFDNNYFNGAIPLINPKQHEFRDVDMSSRGFSPFRPNATEIEFSHSVKNSQHKGSDHKPGDKKYFLRLREHLKEIHKKHMGFGAPKKGIPLESIPMDTKMIYYPKWREHSPDKWKGKNDFVHTTKAKVRTKTRDFGYTKANISTSVDPYIDGLVSVGERKISRDDNLRKDSPQFSSVIPRDPWNARGKFSESLRAEKALEVLFKNQKHNLKMVSGSRMVSPNRTTNQQFRVQAGDYKLYTTADKEGNASNNAKTRSISTGQAGRNITPIKPPIQKPFHRKSNTARNMPGVDNSGILLKSAFSDRGKAGPLFNGKLLMY